MKRIRITDKPRRRIDPVEVAKALGAEPRGEVLKSLDAIWAAGMNDWERHDDPDAALRQIRDK